MTVHFIVNPVSGGGLSAKMWKKVEPELKNYFVNYKSEFTAGRGHGTYLAREALKSGSKLIVAVGGDGIINEVVNGFFENDIPINPDAELGMINFGTGSDFARTIKHSVDFEDILKPLQIERSEPCDVGLCTFTNDLGSMQKRYFINVADMGIGGLVTREKEAAGGFRLGKLGYLLETLKATLSFKNVESEITIDSHPSFNTKILSVIVANGKYFGGNMLISPYSDIYDGYFDVIVIGDVPRLGRLFAMSKIYSGKHLDHKNVGYFRAKKIKIVTKSSALIELDGEPSGCAPVIFEVIKQAVRVKGRARTMERIQEELPVRLKVCRKARENESEMIAMSQDISVGGVKLVIKDKVGVGDEIELKYNLPSSMEPLTIKGDVISVKRGQNDHWEVSVQTTKMNTKDKARLVEYINLQK